MGLKEWRLRRTAEREVDQFWRQGAPFDTRSEGRLGFGFFNAMTQTETAAGVLFVTRRRVVFRFLADHPGVSAAIGMGGFTSAAFVKPYEEITKVVKGHPPRLGCFGILYSQDGQETGLILEPADDEPGVQEVCEEIFEIARDAHQAAMMR